MNHTWQTMQTCNTSMDHLWNPILLQINGSPMNISEMYDATRVSFSLIKLVIYQQKQFMT